MDDRPAGSRWAHDRPGARYRHIGAGRGAASECRCAWAASTIGARQTHVMTFDEQRHPRMPWDDAQELWELQTGPHLTVGELLQVLEKVDPSLEIVVNHFDGIEHRTLLPVDLGYYGGMTERPDGVAITVINQPS
jgi:hypothetical protein